MRQPLWPMPDGWEKPIIRVRGGRFHVWVPDITGGGWFPEDFETLGEALDFAADMNMESTLRTEYTYRRDALARFMIDLVYGTGAAIEAGLEGNHDLILNYRLDADDIIKANPHLLSLGERERLEDQIPELRYE